MRPRTEEQWVERLTRIWPKGSRVRLGPGDDAAVTVAPTRGRDLVSKVDAVVEEVHFQTSDRPSAVGHKALARAISDFAAMGARPRHALITVGFPIGEGAWPWVEGVYSGMSRLAAQYTIGLVGGELTRSAVKWINVTLLGDVACGKAVTRSGGLPGDVLIVTGRLGGSFPKRHLSFIPRLEEGCWLAAAGARAMMDLSDGLGKDLPRLAVASGCTYRIKTKSLPRHRGCSIEQAINDGEDYELLAAIPPKRVKIFLKKWPFSVPLTVIGELLPASQAPEADGVRFSGWDHCSE